MNSPKTPLLVRSFVVAIAGCAIGLWAAACWPPAPPQPPQVNICGDRACSQNNTENCETCPRDCGCPGITHCARLGPPDFPPVCAL